MRLFLGGRQREDASTIIGVQSRGAVIVAVIFLSSSLAVALMTMSDRDSVVPLVAGEVVIAFGLATVCLRPGDPLPMRETLVVAASPLVCLALTTPFIRVPLWTTVQLGPQTGGLAVLTALLAVRGRVLVGWITVVAGLGILACWPVWQGDSPWYGFGQGVSNLAVMTMATFFAYILRPAAQLVYRLRRQAERHAAEEAAVRAASAARTEQLLLVDRAARPMLELVAAGQPLSPARIRESALVEAMLRDSIRASGLQDPRIVDEVWRARERGVRVTMLDDRALSPSTLPSALRECVIEHVSLTMSGEIVIRVQPEGRAALVTVVRRSGGQVYRFEYGDSGDLLTM